jgi:hypothetical protein
VNIDVWLVGLIGTGEDTDAWCTELYMHWGSWWGWAWALLGPCSGDVVTYGLCAHTYDLLPWPMLLAKHEVLGLASLHYFSLFFGGNKWNALKEPSGHLPTRVLKLDLILPEPPKTQINFYCVPQIHIWSGFFSVTWWPHFNVWDHPTTYQHVYYISLYHIWPLKRNNLVSFLTPKDPRVFGCKTTQNYPFRKKDL